MAGCHQTPNFEEDLSHKITIWSSFGFFEAILTSVIQKVSLLTTENSDLKYLAYNLQAAKSKFNSNCTTLLSQLEEEKKKNSLYSNIASEKDQVISKLKNQYSDAMKSNKNLEKILDDTKKELKQLKSDFDQSKLSRNKANQTIDSLEEENKSLKIQIDSLKKEIESTKKEVHEIKPVSPIICVKPEKIQEIQSNIDILESNFRFFNEKYKSYIDDQISAMHRGMHVIVKAERECINYCIDELSNLYSQRLQIEEERRKVAEQKASGWVLKEIKLESEIKKLKDLLKTTQLTFFQKEEAS